MFEGDGYKLVHHLAPPLTAQRTPKGELVPAPGCATAFGGWPPEGLRGTALDIFGKTEERRGRAITEYRACIDELLARLSADLALAVELPASPRGYG